MTYFVHVKKSHSASSSQRKDRWKVSPQPIRPTGDWDRQYTSDYEPMDRWMVTVNMKLGEDSGLTLVQYRNELFVADVDKGPFYNTAMDKGDKILSVNGKKVPKHIKTVDEAERLLLGRSKATIFLLRPDPEKDPGYKWVMENTT